MGRFSQRDYGYDAAIRTFLETGEAENGEFYIQVKATDGIKYSRKHQGYELTLEKRDLELWLSETTPVIIVLFDALRNRGFFLNLHEYFTRNRLVLKEIHKYKQVFINSKNIFTPEVVRQIRQLKNINYETAKGI
jgi:hypothetical protein